jgi:hypothetical protein
MESQTDEARKYPHFGVVGIVRHAAIKYVDILDIAAIKDADLVMVDAL